MDRIPQKIPLPCYGLEHNKLDPMCQNCPHHDGCREYMGSRLDKVTLDRIQFHLVPEAFDKEAFNMAFDVDDPELPYLQRLYADCFTSVFHKNPTDNVSRFKAEIAANARKAECSVRMFMLANMTAHRVHEKEVVVNTEKLRAARFTASLLKGELSIKRAKMYQAMCKDQFGTFSLTSLAILTDTDDKEELEATMLRSEITAAQWLVRYKIFNSTIGEMSMFASEELQLAPEWLAIEDTYVELVMRPYVAKTIRGTEALERHRFNAFQVHGHYKSHIASQRLAMIARQRIMPEAVKHVLGSFNHHPDDFLYPREPVLKPMEFWKRLALTIRHYHCWLYINGEPSYFTPRRIETLPSRS